MRAHRKFSVRKTEVSFFLSTGCFINGIKGLFLTLIHTNFTVGPTLENLKKIMSGTVKFKFYETLDISLTKLSVIFKSLRSKKMNENVMTICNTCTVRK